MIRIEDWSIYESYAGHAHLVGNVFGHPSIPDGEVATSSRIVAIDHGLIRTKSGSIYSLGNPSAAYESLYPNARERVLNQTFDNEQENNGTRE